MRCISIEPAGIRSCIKDNRLINLKENTARVGRRKKKKFRKKVQHPTRPIPSPNPEIVEPAREALVTAPVDHPVANIGNTTPKTGWKAVNENLGTFVANLIKTVGDRIIEEADNTIGFILAALSIAIVHWVFEKTLILAGMNPHSNEAIIIQAVILGCELGLILDFVRRRITRKEQDHTRREPDHE